MSIASILAATPVSLTAIKVYPAIGNDPALVRHQSPSSRILAVLVAASFTIAAPAADAPSITLFDPAVFDRTKLKAEDAIFSLAGKELKVTTGTYKPWPGVAVPAPAGTWDLSQFGYVEVELRNASAEPVRITCRVDNASANGTDHCVNGSARIEPGKQQTVRVDLRRSSGSKLDGKLHGMRGYPVAPGGRGTVDPSKVTQVLLFVTKPGGQRLFEITKISATGKHTAPTAWASDADPFFPFVDALGQYKHKTWPGKTHSVDGLAKSRAAEQNDLARHPGPAGWDRFGGWAEGPKQKATGGFRTEKINGKWWLITPDGHLFFSQGIDCVRARHQTAIEGRDGWFADFPGPLPEFARYHGSGYVLKGDYAGKTLKTFSFNAANLHRKYGVDWENAYTPVIHQRLRSWGLNTIGMWSDQSVRMARKTPYVDAVSSRRVKLISGSEGYWAMFPDPFDPNYGPELRKQMVAKKGGSVGDPWCIGYFSDNEMSWGDDLSLAIASLKSPPDQPAKLAFLSDLNTKYGGIDKLNAAWQSKHESWEALLQSTNAPSKKNAEADLAAFYTRVAEQYFRNVRDAIKEAAPHQLYLGCRFAWVNSRAAAAAAKYCDVVSYNLYRRSVREFEFNGGADVPLIIGEFHFGALDRGMLHTGLVPVATQEERAKAYRSYVEGALSHPQFVGCHWFEYQDEPLTGRVLDEENYQIGFIDVADTPYPEMVAASRDLADRIYRLRLGR